MAGETNGWDEIRPLAAKLEIKLKEPLKIEWAHILEFDGVESLGKPFHFKIIFRVENEKKDTKNLEFSDLDGQEAIFTLTYLDEKQKPVEKDARYFSGKINTFSILARDQKLEEFIMFKEKVASGFYNYYQITLIPAFTYLRDCDTYTDIYPASKKVKSHTDLAALLYKEAAGTEAKLNITKKQQYAAFDYVIRWEESSQQIFDRLLYLDGVTHYYTCDDKGVTMNITDSDTGAGGAKDPIKLVYAQQLLNYQHIGVDYFERPETYVGNITNNSIINIQNTFVALPGKRATVEQYNSDGSENPETISAEEGSAKSTEGEIINPAGSTNYYGEQIEKKKNIGERLAKARQSHFTARQSSIQAQSFNPLVELCGMVEIASTDDTQQLKLDKQKKAVYKPIRIIHRYTQELGYANQLEMIPAEEICAPGKPAMPTLPGIYPAQVCTSEAKVEANKIATASSGGGGEEGGGEGGGGDSAKEQKVYVKFFFDPKETKTPIVARIAQNPAGKSWGDFSVPRQGAEVHCVFPSIDEPPIIIAQTYNSTNIPAFSDQNVHGFEISPVESSDAADGLTPLQKSAEFPKHYGMGGIMQSGSLATWWMSGGDVVTKAAKMTSMTSKGEMTLVSWKSISLVVMDENGENELCSLKMDSNGITLTVGTGDAATTTTLKKTELALKSTTCSITGQQKVSATSDTELNFASKASATFKGKDTTLGGEGPTTVGGATISIGKG